MPNQPRQGRPRVQFVCDQWLADYLQKWADSENRSRSNLIETLLVEVADNRKEQRQESKDNSIQPKQAATIASLVKDNYKKLLDIGLIKTERLEALANGEKPNASDLTKLAHNLDLEEEYIVYLRDRSFPPTRKRREPNGTT